MNLNITVASADPTPIADALAYLGLSLSELGQIATVAGVAAIIFAWWSYCRTMAANRESHMSNLFRDYVQMAFAFHDNDEKRDETHPAYSYLCTYKMWVLEEIWIWTTTVRQFSDRRRRLIENWRNTIKYQFHRDKTKALWKLFDESKGCYHSGFVAFAEEWHPHSPTHTTRQPKCECCPKSGAAPAPGDSAEAAQAPGSTPS